MELDDLMAEMGVAPQPQTQPVTQPVTTTSSSTTSHSNHHQVANPRTTAAAFGSSSDGPERTFTIDDLDDLMAEVESQETRRRAPLTTEVREQGGARKTTTRKSATGALDDHDLDAVLDTIIHAAGRKLAEKRQEIGWGVINAERKFDLRAPSATEIGKPCICTIIVTTSTGERQRVELDKVVVDLKQDGKNFPFQFTDKCDGTYEIVFTPNKLGFMQLNIDTYGKRTFEFPIQVGGVADPSKCEAEVVTKQCKANQPVHIRVIAKDSQGDRFKVGGTAFSIGFAGDGELYNVDLADQCDGSYNIHVTPNKPGNYVVFISLGEVDIAASPVGFACSL